MPTFALSALAAEYVNLPGGSFSSVLPPDGKSAAAVISPFQLRSLPVSNEDFLRFVQKHPTWQRGRVAAVFADSQYLAHWKSSTSLGNALANQPVTHVSWFAAQVYCESEQARLPRWYEWEFAAAADETRSDARNDSVWRTRILNWYSLSSQHALARIGHSPRNFYGVYDLHGLIWEWVDDHGGVLVSGDNREQGDPDFLKFCGAGALSLADRDNYAVLMRIAMLSALKAADTTANLGFRCARERNKP